MKRWGQLEQVDPRKARIVMLRYFTGLSVEETAQALGVSPATVKREWRFRESLALWRNESRCPVARTESVGRLQELFEGALAREGDARRSYLEQECGDDTVLRRQVERLLEADAAEDSMLESPVLRRAASLSLSDEDSDSRIPDQVGRYQIEHIIAAGGMGTVYQAVQDSPRRTVAIKLMRVGLTSRSARQRFQYESEVLARLSHPGIAQIYEAGIHEEDDVRLPFFAMEYIDDARPITTYANEQGIVTRDRLELFAQACDAVHHGHQLGVIHRDLKPANILVDGAGRVKVIDFGVARSTEKDARPTSMQTVDGQLIGTLSYMSPEQTRADPTKIDTRSDVYSLGVVLYEILAGQLPYDVSDSNIVEAARVIQQQPARRLSSVNLESGGDLQRIVGKALEKDPERRYRSAAELADDLSRYLRGEAIIARPPSLMYELRVLVRRNRTAVLATVLLFVVLAIGLAATTALWMRADREQQRAKERESAASEALQLVQSLLLQTSNGSLTGQSKLARSIVKDTEKAIDAGRFTKFPEIEMTIRNGLASIYSGLGEYANSVPHSRRAVELRRQLLGVAHKDTVQAEEDLARSLWLNGRLEEAEQLARRTWLTSRNTFPENTAQSSHLGFRLALILTSTGEFEEAEALIRAELARRKEAYGDETSTVANATWALGNLKRYKEELDLSEVLLREATELF